MCVCVGGVGVCAVCSHEFLKNEEELKSSLTTCETFRCVAAGPTGMCPLTKQFWDDILLRSPFSLCTSASQNALLESKVNPRSLFQCSFLYTKSYFQENSCYGSLVFNLSYNIQVYCVRRSRTVLSFSHKPVIAFDLVTCIRLTFILQLHSKPRTLVSCSL